MAFIFPQIAIFKSEVNEEAMLTAGTGVVQYHLVKPGASAIRAVCHLSIQV